MELHPGLKKYFYALSHAAKVVDERQRRREQLRGYLKKIKIVSSQTAKKSVISSELQKLEKHISLMLDEKISTLSSSKKEQLVKSDLHAKEQELDMKMKRLDAMLAEKGKAVPEPSPVPELESKLYQLESKYLKIRDLPGVAPSLLQNVEEKISDLKEKIRVLKNKEMKNK